MEKILTVAAVVTFVGAIFAGVWWLFYFLWNTIAADIFGAPELTFWQSVGLLVLVGLLTQGFRAATNSK